MKTKKNNEKIIKATKGDKVKKGMRRKKGNELRN
jgi:hypothetical protein